MVEYNRLRQLKHVFVDSVRTDCSKEPAVAKSSMAEAIKLERDAFSLFY